MKRMLLAAALASLAVSAHAASSDQWFYDGLPWYEHPCGIAAFAEYGHDDSFAVRHAYEITKRDPSQCAKLFPSTGSYSPSSQPQASPLPHTPNPTGSARR